MSLLKYILINKFILPDKLDLGLIEFLMILVFFNLFELNEIDFVIRFHLPHQFKHLPR